MAIKMKLFIASVCFMAFIFTGVNSGDISPWCNQTPYPKPCKFHMSHGPWKSPYIAATTTSSSMSRTQFRDMAIQVAMSHALEALDHIKSLGPKWQSGSERAVWTNCVHLYDNTVFQLKKSLSSYVKPTPSDIQTWLSAALTNLHTCQGGFLEMNASKNLTQLISNTLAINIVLLTKEEQSYRSSLRWLSKEDQTYSQHATVVVAQDGLGDFRTIQQAIDASENRRGCERFVIYVKIGIYKEYIEIGQNMRNITMLGDGPGVTIITGSRSKVSGYNTYDSATVKVMGDGFIAYGITFQNTAGPENGQAVAVLSASDCSVFYRCGFEGYQDTLFVYSQRQFYQKCDIYGTVDFIFGNAAVVLQNCNIYARKPLPGGGIVVTAQARHDLNQTTGISIMNSRVIAAQELVPALGQYKAYLGRPWDRYSRVVYMETFLDSLVDPAGWLEWDDPTALSTLYYGEYRNSGPGSSTQGRVKWPGYEVITDESTAQQFTVANLIDGQSWLPNTGVPFVSGLGSRK